MIDPSEKPDTPSHPVAFNAATLFGTGLEGTSMATIMTDREAGHMNASDPINA